MMTKLPKKLIEQAARGLCRKKNIYGNDVYWQAYVTQVTEVLEAALGATHKIVPKRQKAARRQCR